jgi:hypothetical protein
MEKTVFLGFVIACLFAGSPTNLSPVLVNATTEGVVLPPSEFGITTGSLPSITATQEFVVPKSIPIIFPIELYSFLSNKIAVALPPLDKLINLLFNIY